jgi:hypothetical protein
MFETGDEIRGGMTVVRFLFCMAVLAATLANPTLAVAAEEDPAFLVVHGGVYDINRNENRAAEFGAQYRSDYRLWVFKPHAGILGTSSGIAYGYAGLLVDIYFGKRFVVTGSTAVGAYNRGDDSALGNSTIQFRSGIETSYRFDDRSRVGLGFYHISNAGLSKKNPGEETLLVNYAMPIGKIFGQ